MRRPNLKGASVKTSADVNAKMYTKQADIVKTMKLTSDLLATLVTKGKDKNFSLYNFMMNEKTLIKQLSNRTVDARDVLNYVKSLKK